MPKEKGTQNTHQAFTRGTQIFSHNVRMLIQGIKTAFWIALIFTVLWLLFRSLQKANFQDFYYWMCYGWAYMKFDFLQSFFNSDITLNFYSYRLQEWQYVKAIDYIKAFWSTNHGRNITQLLIWLKSQALIELIVAFFTGIIASYWFFSIRGRKKMVKEKIRGNELLKSKVLANKIRKANQASDIEITGLPLIKNSENYHILVTGATGTGKTNLFHEVLPQLRARGDKIVCIDMKGVFVRTYFDTSQDKLLNPFDKNSLSWLPWSDCKNPFDYDALAAALVGKPSSRDSFWEEAAQKVISTALQKKQDHQQIKALMTLLNSSSFEEYSNFFAETDVASMTSEDADRTASSIRATIGNKIKPLSCLKETDEPFSIKKYILDDKDNGWLFMTAPAHHRKTILPLIASWIEIALNGVMQRSLSNKNDNIWFILDELPAMNHVPSLEVALSQSREYGGCVMAGVQNIHQLSHIYGRHQALNLIDQFGTKFIFRGGDKETAQISAKMLGEQEIKESTESTSYGANTIRDGVNINTVDKIKDIVLPTEIMTLDALNCYVKLAGNWPITKLTMKFHDVQFV